MPKMTHWNSPDAIDVPPEKAAVYKAQGWVTADRPVAQPSNAVTRATADPVEAAPVVEAPKPAKKAAAKKAAKKAAAKKIPKSE